jgi:hypothetical protein
MERITDKIAALPSNAHYFSLEFFPPKTDMVRSGKHPHTGKANYPRAHPIFELA